MPAACQLIRLNFWACPNCDHNILGFAAGERSIKESVPIRQPLLKNVLVYTVTEQHHRIIWNRSQMPLNSTYVGPKTLIKIGRFGRTFVIERG